MDSIGIIKDFASGVASNGFAVAVAGYLLIRMETELKALRASIDRLSHCPTCINSPTNAKVNK